MSWRSRERTLQEATVTEIAMTAIGRPDEAAVVAVEAAPVEGVALLDQAATAVAMEAVAEDHPEDAEAEVVARPVDVEAQRITTAMPATTRSGEVRRRCSAVPRSSVLPESANCAAEYAGEIDTMRSRRQTIACVEVARHQQAVRGRASSAAVQRRWYHVARRAD